MGAPVRVLAIGGSDSSGGAGIQADIKTGAALGVDVCTAVTAVTAQNSLGVHAVEPVSLRALEAQLAAIGADIPVQAVKIGMLFDAAHAEAVHSAIRIYPLPNIVCDPVMSSTSGVALLDDPGVKALIQMLPLFALVTPNVNEAALLTGRAVTDAAQLLKAGRALLDMGARAVLLKGGHLEGPDSTDALLQQGTSEVLRFSGLRIATRNDHGTGCVLSTGIACGLARGLGLPEAIASAREFLQDVLAQSASKGSAEGRGNMNLIRNAYKDFNN